jgi:translocation protein SEC62
VRTGVWYLSLGSLWLFGGLMVLAIIRLIIYAFSLVLGKGFWLFPNLFADVGIIDSFIPLYGYDGINYERMHLEKYRRAMKKKKPKKGEETGDQKESKKDQ